MTFEEIKDAIRAADPDCGEEEEAFKAQVVLLASLEVGPNIDRIKRFTGYPRRLVAKFSHFLRQNSIWRGGRVYANWFDPEEGAIAFMLDGLVALGLVERGPPEPVSSR